MFIYCFPKLTTMSFYSETLTRSDICVCFYSFYKSSRMLGCLCVCTAGPIWFPFTTSHRSKNGLYLFWGKVTKKNTKTNVLKLSNKLLSKYTGIGRGWKGKVPHRGYA